MLEYESKLLNSGVKVIIGCDEAGRGPLAGPVVAAAVILRTFEFKTRIDDSKKLSALQRQRAFSEIIRQSDFRVRLAQPEVIDEINILQATRLAMKQAVESLTGALNLKSAHVLIDGNCGLDIRIPQTRIIGGDGLSLSIAAASILAKVTRDRIMTVYDARFPQYGFLKHKGYPTLEHRQAIKQFGLCSIHRRSFSHV